KLISGPAEPTPENLLAPQVGRLDLNMNNGAHTALPVLGMQVAEFTKDKDQGKRDIVVVVDESLANECTEPRQFVWIADVTDEKTPVVISTFNVPESPGNFCSRGGRFGSHSSNENQPPMYYGKYVFVAWFNAGIRAVDIRDPYHPREAGYYIPATTAKTDKRCVKDAAGAERCKIAIQTNNLDVDDRGYLYAVDRADSRGHNAGGSRRFTLESTNEQWEEALTLNCRRHRQLTHLLMGQMIERKWGRIINITGKSEPEGLNGAFAAKAAVHSWAKGLSRDVGRHGITVNCVPPGRIISEPILRNYPPAFRSRDSRGATPLGADGQPDDGA